MQTIPLESRLAVPSDRAQLSNVTLTPPSFSGNFPINQVVSHSVQTCQNVVSLRDANKPAPKCRQSSYAVLFSVKYG